jgi:hypothetical protein
MNSEHVIQYIVVPEIHVIDTGKKNVAELIAKYRAEDKKVGFGYEMQSCQ